MSKMSNKLDKGMSKKLTKQKEPITKKRKLGASDRNESNQTISKMAKQSRSRPTVKRKIDFSNEEREGNDKQVQLNNNATLMVNGSTKLQGNNGQLSNKMVTRVAKAANAKPLEKEGIKIKPIESYRVNWTKEFMEKVKRSNQKVLDKKIQKQKQMRNNAENNTSMIKTSNILQESSKPRGDGVQTEVDLGTSTGQEDMDDIELLDYEDDLSIDEDLEPMEPYSLADNQETAGTAQDEDAVPGTSSSAGIDLAIQHLQEQSEEALMRNPVIQKMMNKFFEEKFKDLQGTNSNSKKKKKLETVIKSPSDTTVYAPALQKRLTPQENMRQTGLIMSNKTLANGNLISMTEDSNKQFTNGYNKDVEIFVDAVRREQQQISSEPDQELDVREVVQRRFSNGGAAAELEQAQQRAQKAVIKAEKFRASVQKPGMDLNQDGNGLNAQILPLDVSIEASPPIVAHNQENLGNVASAALNLLNIGTGVSDDDFFHLTCHIEPNLIHKIEKGEFVELEKLLPKEKMNRGDENRLEWVQRDGGTYLVPA